MSAAKIKIDFCHDQEVHQNQLRRNSIVPSKKRSKIDKKLSLENGALDDETLRKLQLDSILKKSIELSSRRSGREDNRNSFVNLVTINIDNYNISEKEEPKPNKRGYSKFKSAADKKKDKKSKKVTFNNTSRKDFLKNLESKI